MRDRDNTSVTLNELKQRRQWIVWRLQESSGGKPTKIPYSPITGRQTGCNEPYRGEWVTYEEAVKAFECGGYNGIAIVLTDGLCGIDIDGKLYDDPDVRGIIKRFNSYTESSPSGTGVHILFMLDPGRLPDDFINTYEKRYYKKNPSNGIECYLPCISGARYFTFTEGHLDSYIDELTNGTLISDCTDVMPSFLNAYMQKREAPEPITLATSSQPVVALTDYEIIRKAESAKNGADFRQLYNGDTSNYGSQSEADLALCSHLAFWCGGDENQMDRLFRASGLMRKKWDRNEYRASTIQKAVSGVTEFYNPQRSITKTKSLYVPENLYEELTDFTDVAFSNLFASVYAQRVRYSIALGWLVWNGMVWQPDGLQAQELLKELTTMVLADAGRKIGEAHKLLADAKIDGDVEAESKAQVLVREAQTYLKFAKDMRKAPKIKGVLSLAASSLTIAIEECDSDPFLLNTPAGTVSLIDGSIKTHDPMDFCTKMTAYVPAEKATDKLWDDFLTLITEGDLELAVYLQTAIGAAAIGRTYTETIIIAHGGGANGKSTFFNGCFHAMGSYAGKMPAEALTTSRGSAKVDLAELFGKRLVIASETEEGQRLSNSMLKQVASADPITAERKYRDPFVFMPSHLLVLYTNFLPKVSSSDKGTWRRLAVTPFNATIANPQTNFLEKLLEQSGGAILRWIIDGAQMYIENGYKLPHCPAVAKAIKQYEADNDWLSQFLEECCEVGARHRVKAGELYQTYNDWGKLTTGYARLMKDFKGALEDRGYQQHRESSGTYWHGISLKRKNYM